MNDDSDNEIIQDNIRCHKTLIKCKQNSIKFKLLQFMASNAKAIFNSCIYFLKHMYFIRNDLIKYYVDHFDEYVQNMSFSDILTILKYISYNTQIDDAKKKYICKMISKFIYSEDMRIINRKINCKFILDVLSGYTYQQGKSESINMNYREIAIKIMFIRDKTKLPKKHKVRLMEFIRQSIITFNSKYDIYNEEVNVKNRERRKQIREEKKMKKIKKNTKKKKKKKVEIYSKQNIVIPVMYSSDVIQVYLSNFIDPYKQLPSDVAVQTVNKVINAYNSYFSLKKKDNTSKPPQYIQKNGLYNLIFQKKSFKIYNFNKISKRRTKKRRRNPQLRLSLGLNVPSFISKFGTSNKKKIVFYGSNSKEYTFMDNIKENRKNKIKQKLKERKNIN